MLIKILLISIWISTFKQGINFLKDHLNILIYNYLINKSNKKYHIY